MLEVDFDKALDVAKSCADNPSVIDANKYFQEFVSSTTIESTLEAHSLTQQAKGVSDVVRYEPPVKGCRAISTMRLSARANNLLNQAKELK